MSNSFKRFLVLCLGEFVAAIGHGISSFGLSIYVFEQTGLASSTSLIELLAFLPALLLSPMAGVLADKYDRRILMILGDGLSALGIAFILIFMVKDGNAAFWQICVGVTISSIFTSLVDPAFKATVTDLLSKEEYTKASGFVQLSSASKYLLSPAICAALFAFADIRLFLLIDICTVFVTVATTMFVRKGIVAKPDENRQSLFEGLKTGFSILIKNKGVIILTVMGSLITFFVAAIQTLSTPMVLAFADKQILGVAVTICACGMLISGLILGAVPLKKNIVRTLFTALIFTGIFMVLFGLRENAILVGVAGFLFFAMLPFANTSIDYLIRINVENEYQGRIWGFISIISQFGYVVAYAIMGPLADFVFVPLLVQGGPLAGSVGRVIGVSNGRGIGLMIIIAGILLIVTSVCVYQIKSVRKLGEGGALHTSDSTTADSTA